MFTILEISRIELLNIPYNRIVKLYFLLTQFYRIPCANADSFLATQLLCIIYTIRRLKTNYFNYYTLINKYFLLITGEYFLQIWAISKICFLNISIKYID